MSLSMSYRFLYRSLRIVLRYGKSNVLMFVLQLNCKLIYDYD